MPDVIEFGGCVRLGVVRTLLALGWDLALAVAQFLQDRKNLFVRDESTPIPHLVLIDRDGQLASGWREIFVAVCKLAAFNTRWGGSAIAAVSKGNVLS